MRTVSQNAWEGQVIMMRDMQPHTCCCVVVRSPLPSKHSHWTARAE